MVEQSNNFEGDTNRVLLRGWLDSPVKFNHQTEGSAIYSTKIRIERKPGVVDIIPVYIKEDKLVFLRVRPQKGDYMEVEGYIHSKDIYTQDRIRKIEHYVYVDKFGFSMTTLPSVNEVHLTGQIYRTRAVRTAKNGDKLMGFLLKVRRKSHKYSRIPCTVWGIYKVAKMEAAKVGTKIELFGRLQSRKYSKFENGLEISKTVYEVSVTDFEIKES